MTGGTVLASAADARYGWYLLNLIGSVTANSRVFDRIVVHDLGLTQMQRRFLNATRGVEMRSVPPFVEHWAQGFTWKPWIWTHLEADVVVYLDAGTTVLRSLADVLDGIRRRGYFVVSQGRALAEIVPTDYFDLYGVSPALGGRDYVAAGILGFLKDSPFYHEVIEPTYADCLAGRNLGVSASEAAVHTFSIGPASEVVLRDCERFRHDQTILNLHFVKAVPEAEIADLDCFGGWRSPGDHPEQVIWNHRRRGDFRYLARVPYRLPTALVGVPLGAAITARWWVRMHRWLFRPSLYLAKLRRLTRRST